MSQSTVFYKQKQFQVNHCQFFVVKWSLDAPKRPKIATNDYCLGKLNSISAVATALITIIQVFFDIFPFLEAVPGKSSPIKGFALDPSSAHNAKIAQSNKFPRFQSRFPLSTFNKVQINSLFSKAFSCNLLSTLVLASET